MKSKTEGKISSGLLGPIIGAAAIIIAAIITVLFSSSGSVNTKIEARGKISIPRNNVSVERNFLASGELENIPRNHSIWLAVEKENLIWPKKPTISPNDKRWSKMIEENSIPLGETFSLSLLCVSPKAQAIIEHWLEQCSLKGEYPGLREIEEVSRLDVVNNITLRSGKKQSGISTGEDQDTVVYITKAGKKYHREYCGSLKKSKIRISLGKAKQMGYTACLNCRPPQ